LRRESLLGVSTGVRLQGAVEEDNEDVALGLEDNAVL